jgi:hypothetical protein
MINNSHHHYHHTSTSSPLKSKQTRLKLPASALTMSAGRSTTQPSSDNLSSTLALRLRINDSIQPLVRIYIWRCSNPECHRVNKTMSSEAGHVRERRSGYQLMEPCWSGKKCEFCSVLSSRETCLLEIILVEAMMGAKDKSENTG